MNTQKPKPPPDADSPTQSKRFIDMAREVETDESAGAFEKAFDRISKVQPKNIKQSQNSQTTDGPDES